MWRATWHVMYENLHGHTTDTSWCQYAAWATLSWRFPWNGSLVWLCHVVAASSFISTWEVQHSIWRQRMLNEAQSWHKVLRLLPTWSLFFHTCLPSLLYSIQKWAWLTQELHLTMVFSSGHPAVTSFCVQKKIKLLTVTANTFLPRLCLSHWWAHAISVPGPACWLPAPFLLGFLPAGPHARDASEIAVS